MRFKQIFGKAGGMVRTAPRAGEDNLGIKNPKPFHQHTKRGVIGRYLPGDHAARLAGFGKHFGCWHGSNHPKRGREGR